MLELDDFHAWVRQNANLRDKNPPKEASFPNKQAYYDAVGNSVLNVLTHANQKKAIKAFKGRQEASHTKAPDEIISACAGVHDQSPLEVLRKELEEQTALLHSIRGSIENNGKYTEA